MMSLEPQTCADPPLLFPSSCFFFTFLPSGKLQLGGKSKLLPGGKSKLPPGGKPKLLLGVKSKLPQGRKSKLQLGGKYKLPPGVKSMLPPGCKSKLPPGCKSKLPPGCNSKLPPGCKSKLQLVGGPIRPSRWLKATNPPQELKVGTYRAPYLVVWNILSPQTSGVYGCLVLTPM